MKNDDIVMPNSTTTASSVLDSPIKSVNFPPHPQSRLDSMLMKCKPMSDASIPFRDVTSVASKHESYRKLIDKLDVENSIRYQRTIEDTYCNVYSFDYCYFSNIYLPTVWWTPAALQKVLEGETPEVIFGETVDHIYSSAIHDWFLEWGTHFGWKKMHSVDEMQQEVNTNGGVGIICAKRKIKGLSGHIVPVVPETPQHQAYRENGKVLYPLQSQAGKVNYKYFAAEKKDWWKDELYSSYVLYYHD
jgi:hypothetical protein